MTNMYRLSVKQWNPFVGCLHGCSYCKSSFQAQLKRWAKSHCRLCYEFKPHCHPERLDQKMPRTGFMQFIFTCSNGDIAFCPTHYLEQIIEVIEKWKDRTFLIQSKNPFTFSRVKFPKNVILGTTLETNMDNLVSSMSTAPLPSLRFKHFLEIDHQLKMATLEPMLAFNLDIMIDWMERLKPAMIWLGYNSKPKQNIKMGLYEPSLSQVKQLHWELSKRGFVVILKTIRKAWWEEETDDSETIT